MQIHPFNSFALGILLIAGFVRPASASYSGWRHTGIVHLLTTPEGADLPATATISDFPVLVRLDKDWFEFDEAKPDGADIRFSSASGEPLAYQIEEWDAGKGSASIWVRVPGIKGNAVQELKLHWGKSEAASESNPKAVFNESNGHLSVWHMGDPVVDDAGGTTSTDQGTTATAGIVGQARHLAGKQGIFGGDMITTYPSGTGPMTTEAWFRAERTNGTVVAWGEEKRPSKVMVNFTSPPGIAIQCYFADVEAKTPLALDRWYHVVHTYSEKDSRVYINGVLDGASTPVLAMPETSRLWIGGWYNNYNFAGDIDEVRISKVARPAEWVKLQYENQKPLQTLVGPVVREGSEFSVSPATATVREGGSAMITARAGGALKLYWILKRDGKEELVATDRFGYRFEAGRVTADKEVTLQCKAVYPDGVRTKDIPITIKEDIQEPDFTLEAPAAWDGRASVEVVPRIRNLDVMKAKGAGEVTIKWKVGPFAVIKEIAPGKLMLKRARNSGNLTVTATIDNGGEAVTRSATLAVTEPAGDPWAARTPGQNEKPEDGQFYARDDTGEGTLYCNGTLDEAAGSVFLKIYAGDKLYKNASSELGNDNAYAFAVKLKPGMVKYRVEFGTGSGASEKILHAADDIVCGDAYIIQGQSNALATDTGEKSPPETSEWIRSYGRPPAQPRDGAGNLWCKPVWKAGNNEKAELGWWGMELAKRLVESQKVPVFIVNGAVGGTRIDQHQRNEADPTDLTTIYGRMLWRIREAKLTHGIRAILWHQGENNQGSAAPTGDYDWKSYQDYFVEMSSGWKRDFPNLQHTYVFQIWPNSCSMAGNGGGGDRIRDIQRTLPRLFSDLGVMSTLGVQPPGGCHFPLAGWAEFARLIQPLIERDLHGKVFAESITPPDLKQAYHTGTAKDMIALEFDQPVVWMDSLAGEIHLDGEKDLVASGSVVGNIVTLKLKNPTPAGRVTYLKETSWSQDRLIFGKNGIAALTFCEVPVLPQEPSR